jgi:hypothetical protein
MTTVQIARYKPMSAAKFFCIRAAQFEFPSKSLSVLSRLRKAEDGKTIQRP